MKNIDILQLTKQAISQATGKSFDGTEHGYAEGLSIDKIIDIGRDVADMENTVEKFSKALVSLIARFECETMGYNAIYDDIMINRIEWGGFIERAKVDLADIIEDPMIELINGRSYADIEHTFFQPKVITKIYEEGKGICVPISITRDILKEAFTNESTLNTFISTVRASVGETVKMAMDMFASMLVESAIALSVKGTETEVKLKTLAVADGVSGVTANDTPEDLFQNKDFLAYARKKIKTVRSNMKCRTTAYNNKNISASAINQKAYFVTPFVNALTSGILATNTDGFESGASGIGDYREVPMWQAVRQSSDGTEFTNETVMKVMFNADPTNKLGLGTSAFTIDNVVGVAMSEKAIGICAFREKMTNSYTASADFWNEFVHIYLNMILDSDYPIVAFTLN